MQISIQDFYVCLTSVLNSKELNRNNMLNRVYGHDHAITVFFPLCHWAKREENDDRFYMPINMVQTNIS